MKLTNEQEAAALAEEAMVAVVAGPGSGKTALTVERVCRMVNSGTDPRGICVVTFTIAAADEMKARLIKELGEARAKFGFLGTYHAMAMRLAHMFPEKIRRSPQFIVPSSDHLQDLWARTLVDCGAKPVDLDRAVFGVRRPKSFRMSQAQQAAKRAFLDGLERYDLVPMEMLMQLIEKAVTSDCLREVFDHMIVDEAQDMNTVDFQVCRALWRTAFFMVGDPNQSIYGFRGANRDVWRDAASAQYQVRQSFRCSRAVAHAGNALSKFLGSDHRVVPTEETGGCSVLSFKEIGAEAAGIIAHLETLPEYDTVAILSRRRATLEPFLEAAEAASLIVESISQGKPEENIILTRVAAFLNYCHAPRNNEVALWFVRQVESPSEFDRLSQVARDGFVVDEHYWRLSERLDHSNPWALMVEADILNRAQAEALKVWAARCVAENHTLTWGELADLVPGLFSVANGDDMRGSLYHGTIHASKGLEFDHVIVVGLEDDSCPGRKNAKDPVLLADEARLLYVATTRARKSVAFTHCEVRNCGMWKIEGARSRFLDMMADFDEPLPKQ